MAIPKYDEMMLPLLKMLSDGETHQKRELSDKIADHFELSREEREQMLPSVRVTYVKHRAGWAAFGLRKAGLAVSPADGTLRIADEGRKFLATNPTGRLTRAVLMQFEPFRQFTAEMKERAASASRKTGTSPASPPESVADEETTPEERIESAFAELRETLITDVRGKLTSVDPFRFEQIGDGGSGSVCKS